MVAETTAAETVVVETEEDTSLHTFIENLKANSFELAFCFC